MNSRHKWFVIREKNKDAIQIGLTATPRQIKLPELKTGELAKRMEEDRRLLADNLKYFGEPVYEYSYQQGVADGYLAPCEIEQYDIHHDGELMPARIAACCGETWRPKADGSLHRSNACARRGAGF